MGNPTNSPFAKDGPVQTLHRLKVRHRISAIGLVFTFVILGLFLATQQRADAVSGCAVQVKDKTNTIKGGASYFTLFRPPWINAHVMRLQSTLMYWSCEYNQKPDKLRPVYWSHCWTFTSREEHGSFGGVWFNPRALDTMGNRSNPPGYFVPDDGTTSNCKRQYVSLKEAKWLLRSASPKQTVTFKVVLGGQGDMNGYLTDPDTKKGFSLLMPAVDPTIQGRHW